jgi:hypothetical protein
MAERLIADRPLGGKNFIERKVPALPKDYVPRGSPAHTAACGSLDHDIRHRLNYTLIARLGQCPCCGRASESYSGDTVRLRKVLYGRLPDRKQRRRVKKQEAGLQSYIRPVVQAAKPAGPDGIR